MCLELAHLGIQYVRHSPTLMHLELAHLGSQHVGHHVSIEGQVDEQLETLQTEWGAMRGVKERVQLLQEACVVTMVSLAGRQVGQRLQ